MAADADVARAQGSLAGHGGLVVDDALGVEHQRLGGLHRGAGRIGCGQGQRGFLSLGGMGDKAEDAARGGLDGYDGSGLMAKQPASQLLEGGLERGGGFVEEGLCLEGGGHEEGQKKCECTHDSDTDGSDKHGSVMVIRTRIMGCCPRFIFLWGQQPKRQKGGQRRRFLDFGR